MKKVLVLAYDFPPLISIGAQRPYSWYKYFAESNIQVTVVTRQWSSNTHLPEDFVEPAGTQTIFEKDSEGLRTIIRAPFAPNVRDRLILKYGLTRLTVIRKLLSFLYSYLEHIFLIFDAKANIYHEADKLLQHEKFDCIIATGEPFILFKYAHLLSKKYTVPWIADYRDGWTNNQGDMHKSILDKVLNTFFKYRETHYLTNCNLITTAAPGYQKNLQLTHPNHKIQVVYNGYFEEYFSNRIPRVKNEKFIITYAGTIYGYQRLDLFIAGLDKFFQNETNANVEVRFYGLNEGYKEKIIALASTSANYLKFFKKINPDQLAQKLMESNINVLLSAKNVNTLASKIFDYMAAQQPILLVENDFGILQHLLNECKAGSAVETADEVYKFITEYYKKYCNNTLPDDNELYKNYQKYSRLNQTQIMAKLIKNITK